METKPIGAVTIKTRTVRNKPRQQRFVKVSHHGGKRQRWRPFALHWWEQHVGPVPEGYQVFHRDGDSLNDAPDNLVLKRETYWQLIFTARPKAARKQARRRSHAVARSNRERSKISDSQVRARCWYIALPHSKAFVWVPCTTAREAANLLTTEELVELCWQNLIRMASHCCPIFQPGDPIQVVRGRQIIAGSRTDAEFDGYVRLIRDTRPLPKKRQPKPVEGNLELVTPAK